MLRASFLVVFCVFVLSPAGCAWRTASAAVGPSSKSPRTAQNDESTSRARDAIRTLKDRLANKPATASPSEPSMAVVPYGTQPGDAKQIGTGGAWSVENRYPMPRASAAQPAPQRSAPLSRPRQSVRSGKDGFWGLLVVLCVIAAALVLILVVRREKGTLNRDIQG